MHIIARFSVSARGFSLIELLMVLVVISTIITGSLRLHHQYRLQAETDQIRQNAEQLGQSLNLYYYLTCQDYPVPGKAIVNQPVTLEALHSAGVLPEHAVVSIAGVTFSLQISLDSPLDSYYHLWVMATIKQPQAVVDYIRTQLNASEDPHGDNTTIAWMKLPVQKTATMDTANWMMNAGLQEFNKRYQIKAGKSSCTYIANGT